MSSGKLRKLGIRTICNFKEIVKDDNYKDLAQATDIKPEKLKVVMDLLKTDVITNRIEEITQCCIDAAKKEKAGLDARR